MGALHFTLKVVGKNTQVLLIGGKVFPPKFHQIFPSSGSGKGVFWKRGLLEKGSFQKSPFSRDSREFRDSREPPDRGKQRRIRPFSRDSREFRETLEILEIPPVKRPLS